MSNSQATEYKQPEFTLQVTITGVGADIRLNDINIEYEMYSGHSTMTYDVNPSIIAGVNELKIITFPFLDENHPEAEQTASYHDEAEVKATLYVNKKGDLDKKQMLTQIYFRPGLPADQAAEESANIDGVGEVRLDYDQNPISFPTWPVYHQQIVVTRKTLPMQSNYPRWAWQDGQVIEDTQENFDSLLAAYAEIHKAYKNKNVKRLLELHMPRSKEYAIANYLGGVEEGHEFMNTADILNHPRATLYELFTSGSKLDVYANGKMARIIDAAHYHPVVFYDEERDIVHTMKFGFYKNQQGEWIMIR